VVSELRVRVLRVGDFVFGSCTQVRDKADEVNCVQRDADRHSQITPIAVSVPLNMNSIVARFAVQRGWVSTARSAPRRSRKVSQVRFPNFKFNLYSIW
jgi:hypothetical protein